MFPCFWHAERLDNIPQGVEHTNRRTCISVALSVNQCNMGCIRHFACFLVCHLNHCDCKMRQIDYLIDTVLHPKFGRRGGIVHNCLVLLRDNGHCAITSYFFHVLDCQCKIFHIMLSAPVTLGRKVFAKMWVYVYQCYFICGIVTTISALPRLTPGHSAH